MKSSSDTKRDAIAGSKPQRRRPYEPNYLPPSLNMPDNHTKTTATGSGSGTTSSSAGAKSSTGTASSTAAASSSGAVSSATNTSTSSAGNNTASNTAALSEMITNRDPDLLLCLSRGELPRDRTRRAPRWRDISERWQPLAKRKSNVMKILCPV
ncbi:hypothetical protein LMH87_004012 [Akanthomyces muscarius]|uniref:Uncharacterized protein n=1 Tax=Akanthomyces muscarius TaxID=2231603 RepID=A0A9W8UHN5_AKAMU|nr:hypothetical protein LMH87_004012 [Akanthomyces muscarius]KAJ4145154.1 hypothetical protein LMH87_004012 [Akanthomyces muscarius]